MDVLKNFADENPEFLMRNVEVFGSVKIGIGDVYMQFGEPKRNCKDHKRTKNNTLKINRLRKTNIFILYWRSIVTYGDLQCY